MEAKQVPLIERFASVPADARPEQESFSNEAIRATQAAWKMGYDAAKAEQPEQKPVPGVVMRYGFPTLLPDRDIKSTDVRLYTTPPQRKPDYKAFMEWAGKEGYDTAFTTISDNGKFMPLNPMTADLWRAWQAAHGIKGKV